MSIQHGIIVSALLTAASILLVGSPARSQPPKSDFQSLLKQLGSSDFATRQTAHKCLRIAGGPVLSELKKAVKASIDVEQRRRLQQLIEEIEREERTGEIDFLKSESGHWSCMAVCSKSRLVVVGRGHTLLDAVYYSPLELGLLPRKERVAAINEMRKASNPTAGVQVWDTQKHTEMPSISKHKYSVSCVSISADGTLVAEGAADGSLFCWDRATKKEILTAKLASPVASLILMNKSKSIVAGRLDGGISITNLEKRSSVQLPIEHRDRVNQLALNSTEDLLVSGGEDGTVKAWDLRKLRCTISLKHTAPVACIALAPDGRLAAFASGSDLFLWNVSEGNRPKRYEEHRDVIGAVAFSPCGKLLISGGGSHQLQAGSSRGPARGDYEIRLWDVKNGKVIRKYDGHSRPIVGLGFFAAPLQVVSSDYWGTLRVWRIPPIESGQK